jgi:hypothetical protein
VEEGQEIGAKSILKRNAAQVITEEAKGKRQKARGKRAEVSM